MNSEKPTLNLIAPAPVVFGLPFVIGVILHFLFDTLALGLPAALSLGAGAALLVASVALAGWSIATMFRAGENPDPRHPTNALIDTGPFAYSRNPIYVSFVLGGIGIALGINSVFVLGAAAVGAIAIDRLVVAREEQYLLALFGDGYQRYSSRVRRWV